MLHSRGGVSKTDLFLEYKINFFQDFKLKVSLLAYFRNLVVGQEATGADPGFGQGGPQQIISDICRRRAARECERSEHISAGVQGPP